MKCSDRGTVLPTSGLYTRDYGSYAPNSIATDTPVFGLARCSRYPLDRYNTMIDRVLRKRYQASQALAVPRSSVSVPVLEGSQAELVCDSSQLNAPLEDCPPEVRRQLLSILELEDLSALVHASPVFHKQYLLDRRFLLCKCLETTLRSVAIDADTVYQSGLTNISDTCTREKVTEFLKSYQDRRSSTKYSILMKRLAEDEAVGMVAFFPPPYRQAPCTALHRPGTGQSRQ